MGLRTRLQSSVEREAVYRLGACLEERVAKQDDLGIRNLQRGTVIVPSSVSDGTRQQN